MPSRKLRAVLGFALSVLLVVVGLFVADGLGGALTLLAAIFVFIVACIHALSVQDSEAVANSNRIGITGWFGGWF